MSLAKRFSFVLAALIYSKSSLALEKHPSPLQLTTSVIIPCHYKHAYILPSLIRHYEKQTTLPDEIVISLSSANQVPSRLIQLIKEQQHPFPVRLILSEKRLYAGENRNVCARHASGDILICSDADDIPAPQRVETIKHFFQTYKIDHLIHQFAFGDVSELTHDIRNIGIWEPKQYTQVLHAKMLHNGECALTKKLFNKVQWSAKPRGQDVEFNRKVYDSTKDRLVIFTPLIGYRPTLSSIIGGF